MMRITYFCLLFSLTLFTLGCGDDDGGGNNAVSIVGSWDLTAFNGEGTISSEENGTTTTGTFTNVGQNFNTTVVFAENPNQVTGSGSFDATFSITIAGMTFTRTSPVDDIFDTGTWVQNGNTVTITNGMGETFDAEVVELTSNRLRVRALVNITESASGVTSIFAGTYNYTYER